MKNICHSLLLAALLVQPLFSGESASLPNVIVFLSDDQGWGDFSFVGNPNLSTPNIDSLARDGISFENFFVCPVCSPTRAEFLTGRYHPRGGVWGTGAGKERLDLDETTIAEAFKKVGYKTAAFGKWHNGMQAPYHPNSRGFDYFYGFCSGHWGSYFSPMLEENGEITRGTGFVIDDFTDRAIKFIQTNKSDPFFVYLPYNTPHSPMQVPVQYWNRFKDKPIQSADRNADKEKLVHTRAALAMCENIDWNVGRVLKSLDDLELAENTIVVYFCDNGPNGPRWNDGLKGRKGSTDEGGVRSPLLMRWTNVFEKGKRIKHIAGAIDLMPTLLNLIGIGPEPGGKPLDGINLMFPIYENAHSPELRNWPKRKLFSHWGGRVSVRTDQYRLDQNGQLFDVVADPGQRNSINESKPKVVAELAEAIDVWKKEVLSELDKQLRPFTIGHESLALTQLPARDATATGNIKRSNRFPNCSYFTNWTSTDDTIFWPVSVLTEGTYEVELYYSCAASNVGARIELSGLGGSVSTVINAAHDPPAQGAEHDRFERMESYVKDFKPIKMGSIKLNEGRGQLTLRCTEMPGEGAIEFRLLTLRLLKKNE